MSSSFHSPPPPSIPALYPTYPSPRPAHLPEALGPRLSTRPRNGPPQNPTTNSTKPRPHYYSVAIQDGQPRSSTSKRSRVPPLHRQVAHLNSGIDADLRQVRADVNKVLIDLHNK